MPARQESNVYGHGATFALFGAMAGALISQLGEFEASAALDIWRVFGFSFAVVAACVSASACGRAAVRHSARFAATLVVFLACGFYMLFPEVSIVFMNGRTGLSPEHVVDAAIKLVVLGYIVTWGVASGIAAGTDRKR